MCIQTKTISAGHAPLRFQKRQDATFKDDTTNSLALGEERCRKRGRIALTPKKKVSFDPNCQGRLVMSVSDYSTEEKNACWFSHHEYSIIHQRLGAIVRRMIEGEAEGMCIHGLEHMAPEASKARQARKESAYDAVMNEQELQFRSGVYDPERLSALYLEASSIESLRLAFDSATRYSSMKR